MKKTKNVLLTGPALDEQGGVSSYYNAVLPHLRDSEEFSFQYLEVGRTSGRGSKMHVIKDQRRLLQLLHTNPPDILHINPSLVLNSFLRDGVFAWQARRLGIPTIVFFHGWEVSFEARVEGVFRRFFNATFRRAAALMVLASVFRERLLVWGVESPVSVVKTTVNDGLLAGFDLEKKVRSCEGDTPLKVLFMARLEYAKGVIDVLDAVLELLRQGQRLHLTIAGDGPAMNDVRAKLENYPQMKTFIDIVGYVRGEDKARLLQSHHVFCFPTLYAEGMPISVLEAIAFGMPVITCAVGGLKDFFIHGEMGYMFEDRASHRIQAALLELSNDRALLERMGRFNYRYAQDYFMPSDIAVGLLDLYSAVLAPESAPCAHASR